MYRRSKFLEVLLDLRQEMAREADYDLDLFAEMIRSGRISEPRVPAAAGEPDRGIRARTSHNGRDGAE
jgi:hypothetical protein